MNIKHCILEYMFDVRYIYIYCEVFLISLFDLQHAYHRISICIIGPWMLMPHQLLKKKQTESEKELPKK